MPAACIRRHVGTVAGQQKHGVGRVSRRVSPGAPTAPRPIGRRRISRTLRVERAAIEPSLMRFSMSGRTQYLIVLFSSGGAVHERDRRAGPVQLERRFGGRIAAADDHDPLPIGGMRIAVEVADVRKILARDAQHDRPIVVADGEDDVRAPDARASHPTAVRVSTTKRRPRRLARPARRVAASRVTAVTVSPKAICRS